MAADNRIPIFKLFNFQVRADISWIFIAILIVWSLATGYFPYTYTDFSLWVYIWMGVSGALGLFLSVIFHELSHSLVSRRFGMKITGITLFVFGGVSEMEDEPPGPKAEFFMAIAGPVSSAVLWLVFQGLYRLGNFFSMPVPVTGVLFYLSWINLLLAGFNLVPAFPLDGGRILRAILWSWKKDLFWSTRVASWLGSAFGVFLSIMGIIYFFGGSFVVGFWYFLIGLFLQGAARSSYQRLLMMRALQGETIVHFMKKDPITAPASITIQQLVEDYIYKYHYKFFPVLEHEKLMGCINTRDVREIPKEKWTQEKVADVSKYCGPENTISTDTDAMKALSIMNSTHKSRLMVVEDGKLLGIVTLKDLLKFISVKMDLEGVNVK